MIQLQHLCGARPQEVISIRPCEIITDGDVWLYQPRSHKTEHLDRSKVIMLGPKAQVVLRPWLERDPGVVLLRPRGGDGLAPPTQPPTPGIAHRRTVMPGPTHRGELRVSDTHGIATAWRSRGPAGGRVSRSGRRGSCGIPGRR